uniref:FAD-binding protein n=1 Tax=Slackia heliotrinireducens TaxID=84110 RepID=UPI0033145DEF
MRSEQTMNRRSFLAMGGIGAGTAALALAGCAPRNATQESAQDNSEPQSTDWLGSAPEIVDTDIVETIDTDLLIVGAGNAGCVAAATAANLDMNFIVCEKNNSVATPRYWNGFVNTSLHEEVGLSVDKMKALNELTRYASGNCDQEVWKTWLNESAETFEFIDGIMSAAGFDVYLDTEGYGNPQGGTDYYAPPIQHMWYREEEAMGLMSLAGMLTTSSNRNLELQSFAESKGESFRFGHAMVKLLRENDGPVTGAIFETSDGYVQINATNTLLCCGGYSNNPIMVNALAPEIPRACTTNTSQPGCDGDGIKAALWVGAEKDILSAPMIFDRGAATADMTTGYVGEGADAILPSMGMQALGSLPFMKVNKNGVRFCNESAPYDVMQNAAARQPDGVWATIVDADHVAQAMQLSVIGCAKSGVELLMVGTQMGGMENVSTPAFDMGVMFDKGYMFKADSLEAIADAMMLPQQELLAQVSAYNAMCEAGEDTQFGKEAYRLTPIKTPPFYGWYGSGVIICTLDGLTIDKDMRVKDVNGS